jgi:hypothetical protein
MPLIFALLLILSSASRAAAQDPGNSPSIPKQLTLNLELQGLPGRDVATSTWEVSYQWRIADQRDFDRWAAKGQLSETQGTVGILLSKQSFTRRNLSLSESRRFNVSVPVRGELLERLRNARRSPQVVWLESTVRISDAKLGTNVIKNVNPVWGPRFFPEGVANLRMEVTSDGKLRWFTTATPPWDKNSRRDPENARIMSQ